MEEKSALLGYLRDRRADLPAKLDGLGEYDVRRPMTPTGTNLLGLVKHVAYVQLGYLGDVFGRPSGPPVPVGRRWRGGRRHVGGARRVPCRRPRAVRVLGRARRRDGRGTAAGRPSGRCPG